MGLRTLWALVVCAAVVGCSSGGGLPPAATQNSTDGGDYAYLIGAGDQLQVFVWGNPEVSGAVTVRPDGRITTALVEDLPAAGQTPSELARALEAKLKAYIRDPKVTVTVTGFVGPYAEQVRVIGEAANPRAIPYRHNMTLLDVLIEVGGLTPYAAGNRARLVRVEADGQRSFNLRLDDLLRDGDIAANVDVKPGDVIIVPEAWF
ncbi:MAG: polysaccharide export protein [Gammaproteobacteria bacterium]|nr:polysaccharide export protein [Gammaproteobacteria bacterium]